LQIEERFGIAIAAVGVPLAAYLLIGYFTAGGQTYTLVTWYDSLVPLAPAWVIPYIYMYISAAAPAFAVEDVRVLKRWALTVALMYLLAAPIWIFYPVAVPRTFHGGEDYFSYLLGLIQALDPPTNCFPSMHVAVATVAALVVRRVDRLVGTILLGSVFPIWYSTVAVGQHWIVDGAAGLALALVAYGVVYKINPLPVGAFGGVPRYAHLLWAGVLFFALVGLGGMWMIGIP